MRRCRRLRRFLHRLRLACWVLGWDGMGGDGGGGRGVCVPFGRIRCVCFVSGRRIRRCRWRNSCIVGIWRRKCEWRLLGLVGGG